MTRVRLLAQLRFAPEVFLLDDDGPRDLQFSPLRNDTSRRSCLAQPADSDTGGLGDFSFSVTAAARGDLAGSPSLGGVEKEREKKVERQKMNE